MKFTECYGPCSSKYGADMRRGLKDIQRLEVSEIKFEDIERLINVHRADCEMSRTWEANFRIS